MTENRRSILALIGLAPAVAALPAAASTKVKLGTPASMEIVGGKMKLLGPIRLGTGQGWPVARLDRDFAVKDGEETLFGGDLSHLPSISFAQDGLAPLGVDETYRFWAQIRTDGFIPHLKIVNSRTGAIRTATPGDCRSTVTVRPA